MDPALQTTTLTPWDDIVSFFPNDWRKLADDLHVMKGARRDKSLDATMRTLMMHLTCGYSLKETVARARLSKEPLYTSSHVALRDRLIKFLPLFRELSKRIFDANVASVAGDESFKLIDATDIHENGPTGSLWRLHFSFSLPSLSCDHIKLTGTSGKGTGENLTQFPLSRGDHAIADRGYSRNTGITYADKLGCKVCVRLNYGTLKLFTETGKPLGLISKLRQLRRGGESAEWRCAIKSSDDGSLVKGRACAIRKTEAQIAEAMKRQRHIAGKKQRRPNGDTLFVNEYIILFTTFEPDKYPLRKILEIYRWRWQIELLFKRLKSLIQLGHLPTKGDESSRAWLYGKLFSALLIERISRSGNGSFSPWREDPDEDGVREPLETVRFSSALAGVAADTPDVIA